MNGEKRPSYRPPADNNWINFAENWLCFDALVADWWSPAFFAYLSFVFYLLLADLSMVPFWAPLIKQLFNKRERQLHSLCRDSPLSLAGNVGMNINEDSHARAHTHTQSYLKRFCCIDLQLIMSLTVIKFKFLHIHCARLERYINAICTWHIFLTRIMSAHHLGDVTNRANKVFNQILFVVINRKSSQIYLYGTIHIFQNSFTESQDLNALSTIRLGDYIVHILRQYKQSIIWDLLYISPFASIMFVCG